MCFTPAVSLTAAIIEFAVAIFVLLYFKKSPTKILASLVLFVLGLYQFSEFMFCISDNAFLWAKLGFVIYSFLPAIGLHFAIKSYNKKARAYWVYIIPLIYVLIALLTKDFIVQAGCLKYYLSVQHIFHSNMWLFVPYGLYYFGYIVASAFIFWFSFKKEKDKQLRTSKFFMFLAMITLILGAAVLKFLFPAIKLEFPSVYCIFAAFFTVIFIVDAFYSKKI